MRKSKEAQDNSHWFAHKYEGLFWEEELDESWHAELSTLKKLGDALGSNSSMIDPRPKTVQASNRSCGESVLRNTETSFRNVYQQARAIRRPKSGCNSRDSQFDQNFDGTKKRPSLFSMKPKLYSVSEASTTTGLSTPILSNGRVMDGLKSAKRCQQQSQEISQTEVVKNKSYDNSLIDNELKEWNWKSHLQLNLSSEMDFLTSESPPNNSYLKEKQITQGRNGFLVPRFSIQSNVPRYHSHYVQSFQSQNNSGLKSDEVIDDSQSAPIQERNFTYFQSNSVLEEKNQIGSTGSTSNNQQNNQNQQKEKHLEFERQDELLLSEQFKNLKIKLIEQRRRQIEEKKKQNREIKPSERRADVQLTSQFKKQIAESLAKANANFLEKFASKKNEQKTQFSNVLQKILGKTIQPSIPPSTRSENESNQRQNENIFRETQDDEFKGDYCKHQKEYFSFKRSHPSQIVDRVRPSTGVQIRSFHICNFTPNNQNVSKTVDSNNTNRQSQEKTEKQGETVSRILSSLNQPKKVINRQQGEAQLKCQMKDVIKKQRDLLKVFGNKPTQQNVELGLQISTKPISLNVLINSQRVIDSNQPRKPFLQKSSKKQKEQVDLGHVNSITQVI